VAGALGASRGPWPRTPRGPWQRRRGQSHGAPQGPWPRSPAGVAACGPWPRALIGARRSLAKDLGGSNGDLVREVLGQGPQESLAKDRGVPRSLAKDLGLRRSLAKAGREGNSKSDFHLARALGVSRGAWPMTPAGVASRGPWPRTLAPGGPWKRRTWWSRTRTWPEPPGLVVR
jgi:hypothetical protein